MWTQPGGACKQLPNQSNTNYIFVRRSFTVDILSINISSEDKDISFSPTADLTVTINDSVHIHSVAGRLADRTHFWPQFTTC